MQRIGDEPTDMKLLRCIYNKFGFTLVEIKAHYLRDLTKVGSRPDDQCGVVGEYVEVGYGTSGADVGA